LLSSSSLYGNGAPAAARARCQGIGSVRVFFSIQQLPRERAVQRGLWKC
jgi:hypothetical protein